MALIGGSEFLRRRQATGDVTAVRPDHVPSSLAAAGVAIVYGSIYAGYVLYDLIPPLAAYGLLASVSLVAIGLSLLHGRLVGILGIMGAFALPALVSTPSPSLWGLYSYLTFVAGAAFWVVRYKSWWWFSTLITLGATAWDLARIIHGAD